MLLPPQPDVVCEAPLPLSRGSVPLPTPTPMRLGRPRRSLKRQLALGLDPDSASSGLCDLGPFPSLSLCFLICKMRIKTELSTKDCCLARHPSLTAAPGGWWLRLRKGGCEARLPVSLVWFSGRPPSGLSSGLEESGGVRKADRQASRPLGGFQLH